MIVAGHEGRNSSRHDQNGERRPCHRRKKRSIDRREEQVAVEITRQQAKRDCGKPGPPSDRQARDRQQRSHPGEPDQKRHAVADGEAVGDLERLHEGREHVKPWAVVPQREFHGFEMRAVGKAARVPGERLWTVIVRIELIDGDPVIGCGCQSHDSDCAEQGGGKDHLGIDCFGTARPPGAAIEGGAAASRRVALDGQAHDGYARDLAGGAVLQPSRGADACCGSRRHTTPACGQFATSLQVPFNAGPTGERVA